MDTLHLLRRSDLKELMAASPAELPGRILCMNRLPRYHNQLDAIAISVQLLEMRSPDIGARFGTDLPVRGQSTARFIGRPSRFVRILLSAQDDHGRFDGR